MKTFQEFLHEIKIHKFEVGDVVHVRWHQGSSDPVSHGTTKIDRASDTYAHAQHPTIPSLKLKVHQGSGRETGASRVQGHYRLHKE